MPKADTTIKNVKVTGNKKCISSLFFGILSLITSFVAVGFFLGIIGFIYAIIGWKEVIQT